MVGMPGTVKDLIALLDLECIEEDLFRGRSPETAQQRVFGGQVAAQALVAAGRAVVAERPVHSLHAYFLRPGDPAVPLIYAVDRVRDGRSFTTRRVVARQHNVPIFVMSASFQVPEPGFDHQDPMPDAPDPETLASIADRAAAVGGEGAERWARLMEEFAPIDVRFVGRRRGDQPDGTGHKQEAHPVSGRAWMRVVEPLPDDPLLHVCVLAYLSDLTLLSVTLVPHGVRPMSDEVQMASLDHALWFHRPFRADGWLLYDQVSPAATGARGLAAGRIFTQAGAHVATVMQEGLIRRRSR
jgi:acyl-CoA thioesterase II